MKDCHSHSCCQQLSPVFLGCRCDVKPALTHSVYWRAAVSCAASFSSFSSSTSFFSSSSSNYSSSFLRLPRYAPINTLFFILHIKFIIPKNISMENEGNFSRYGNGLLAFLLLAWWPATIYWLTHNRETQVLVFQVMMLNLKKARDLGVGSGWLSYHFNNSQILIPQKCQRHWRSYDGTGIATGRGWRQWD